MKKYIIVISAVLFCFLYVNMLFAAGNTWTHKTDFGGTARQDTVGFSIGSKGYIGTGSDGSVKKDFWEYDPAANVWTQKVDLAGTVRTKAVGFSIGNKGYIGAGSNGSYSNNNFWEYDPAANIWTQKADFGTTRVSTPTQRPVSRPMCQHR